jgi:hypothetical protein
MIDRPARNSLAQYVRQLSVGSITTDDFACAACEIAESSKDAGVKSVYAFADSLYDNDHLFCSNRLRGRYRLPPDVRRQMAIATLFLHSDAEYEWPDDDGNSTSPDCLLLLLCALTASAGLFLFGVFPLLSVCFLALAAAVFVLSRRFLARQHSKWVDRQNVIGDFDVWPFIRCEDFNKARRHPVLLNGGRYRMAADAT